ncbi:NUDIX hydrolase [Tengunoibacter tsumagoiensis]|uniref:NUDIX hydrolase n=1 Tax=Tengunoibacter tsumagoiensis TaxID=2014871 RepID=A0A402A005_9CHLR|nr:NUDIX hydrolase [Tengunoibacter tsumagoiensis]GCE12399.1 NUDIX hydrolase [Tengunoibacter tsumagoiensis]
MIKKKLAPWEVLESTISYEDRWLKVRSDRCRTPQGSIIEPYHVIECSTWVNVLALTPEGQVILVREYRHGVRQILLGLPGGGVETTDEDVSAAIKRELLEETGYSGGTFFSIGQSYANPSNQDNTVWSFLAVDVTLSQEQQLDEAEHIEIVLHDFISFHEQVWSGAIPMQALYLATVGFATQFILRSTHPSLQPIRTQLLHHGS